MCLKIPISDLLKQVFSPAVRLWIVRELLPQERYLEVTQDFLELSERSNNNENEKESREQIQAWLSQWARKEQWQYFIPAIEIIFQIAHQENRQAALKSLSKSWPKHLVLSEEGFIQYRNNPLLQHINQSTESQEKEGSTETIAEIKEPTAPENRKEIFQRIRQKRLLLLKQWESL